MFLLFLPRPFKANAPLPAGLAAAVRLGLSEVQQRTPPQLRAFTCNLYLAHSKFRSRPPNSTIEQSHGLTCECQRFSSSCALVTPVRPFGPEVLQMIYLRWQRLACSSGIRSGVVQRSVARLQPLLAFAPRCCRNGLCRIPNWDACEAGSLHKLLSRPALCSWEGAKVHLMVLACETTATLDVSFTGQHLLAWVRRPGDQMAASGKQPSSGADVLNDVFWQLKSLHSWPIDSASTLRRARAYMVC